jgi:hypothetical protein
MPTSSRASSSVSSVISNAVIDDAVLELRRMTEMLATRTSEIPPLAKSLPPHSRGAHEEEKTKNQVESGHSATAVNRRDTFADPSADCCTFSSLHNLSSELESTHRDELTKSYLWQQQQQSTSCFHSSFAGPGTACRREALHSTSSSKRQPRGEGFSLLATKRRIAKPELPGTNHVKAATMARAVAANVRVALSAQREAVAALRRQEMAVENIQRCIGAMAGGTGRRPPWTVSIGRQSEGTKRKDLQRGA